jgi:hypothetical protein
LNAAADDCRLPYPAGMTQRPRSLQAIRPIEGRVYAIEQISAAPPEFLFVNNDWIRLINRNLTIGCS